LSIGTLPCRLQSPVLSIDQAMATDSAGGVGRHLDGTPFIVLNVRMG
jgi:hypothetical protein